MRIGLYLGDLVRAPAEALCSSTNPELKLMVGTGGALRTAGGWEVQDECDRLLAAERDRTGRRTFELGSAHRTGPGRLPVRGLIHCVAIDAFHGSSTDVIAACTRNALSVARGAGFASIALPAFATGNGRFDFARSLGGMLDVLLDYADALPEAAWIVVRDRHRGTEALALAKARVPGLEVREDESWDGPVFNRTHSP